jgi:hypothetical protein
MRLEAEEKARIAKRPRHDVLNFKTLAETDEPQEISQLSRTMQNVAQTLGRHVGDPEAFNFQDEAKHKTAVNYLREKLENLKVVSRAKVTTNRVYCAAYHPETTKDILFFGGRSKTSNKKLLNSALGQINMVS